MRNWLICLSTLDSWEIETCSCSSCYYILLVPISTSVFIHGVRAACGLLVKEKHRRKPHDITIECEPALCGKLLYVLPIV